MSDRAQWAALDSLRKTLTEGNEVDLGAAEGDLALADELVLDALHRGDRDELHEGWRRLRRIYELLAARIGDDYERALSFHLGRVVQLVELLAAAARRTLPVEVERALDDPTLGPIVRLLANGPLNSSALMTLLDGDVNRTTLWRRLQRLNDLGLVISRKSGRALVSRLTVVGEDALAKHMPEAPAETPPAGTDWNLGEPVKVA